MKKGLFVTATSTGIGKTVFSAIFCSILAEAGFKTGYYKPVQSGAIMINKQWVAPDCLFVESCLRPYGNCTTYNTYLLKKPVSPHFAARQEHTKITLEKILEDYTRLITANDYVIVEGAGGLYVPLDEKLTLTADIPAALGIHTVLIAPAGLGTINHTALSFAFARSRQVHITAIILITDNKQATEIEEENAVILKKITTLDRIYLVPRVPDVDVDANKPGKFGLVVPSLSGSFNIQEWINA